MLACIMQHTDTAHEQALRSSAMRVLLWTMLQVVPFTSDLRGASTDASVHVELFDASGASSGVKQLATSAPDAFERGRADTFRITCSALGSLTKLRIGHDSRGTRPGWHLAKVR